MTNSVTTTPSQSLAPACIHRPVWVRALVMLALAAAMVFAVSLGVRLLSSPDVGYHLAYGDEFWRTGRPVDYCPYIYTLPAADTPPDKRPQPGPGCWYDAAGHYRFANANWGTQVVMSAVNHAGGTTGLCMLGASLVAGIFVLALLTMLRLGVPKVLAAAGVVLIGLTAYERFMVRPELFGYLLLMAELYLLCGRRIGWVTGAVLVLLQLLFVNVHSYFMLGLAMSGAFFGEAVLRRLWPLVRGKALSDEQRQELRRRLVVLGVVLAAQVAVSFVNPWTWRLAVLPFQTLVFISQNHITEGLPPGWMDANGLSPNMHPWRVIGEFFSPLSQDFLAGAKATIAYKAVLVLAGLGMLGAMLRRRWAMLAILIAITMVSTSMRRNIAPAAMVIVPLALACLAAKTVRNGGTSSPEPGGARAICPTAGPGSRFRVPSSAGWRLVYVDAMRVILLRAEPYAAATVLLAAGVLTLMVTRQYFYYSERMPTRFGVGMSNIEIPSGSAKWLNQYKPVGRLWVDCVDSSNLYYMCDGRYDVPVLTNTWAFPPSVMQYSMEGAGTIRGLNRAVKEYDIQIVAFRINEGTGSLAQSLLDNSGSAKWRLVYLDAIHVILLRADGPNAALASQAALSPQGLDASRRIESLERADPVPSYSLMIGGVSLYLMGWHDQAIAAMEESLRQDPSYASGWNWLGLSYVRRGDLRAAAGNMSDARADRLRAQQCFEQACVLEPEMPGIGINLKKIHEQLTGQ